MRADVAALQKDEQVLSAENVLDPGGAASAIAGGQQAVKDAISKANADIDAVAGDVTKAYEVASSLATGACSGSGPGSAPSSPAHLS